MTFVAIALVSDERAEHVVYLLAFAGWVGGAVFLGTAQHNRRAYLAELEQRARDLEETRDEEARRRVAEERLRIARDLHDVIAHGIATIHMQSSVALHVLDRHPEQADRRSPPSSSSASRRSTSCARRWTCCAPTTATTRPLAPTPGLDQLEALVDITRRAGLPVDAAHRRRRPRSLPAAVDVAAYRIVQESLTNVMRHAGDSARATVTVAHGAGAVEVEVVDDGLGAAAATRRRGHGIVGHGRAGGHRRRHARRRRRGRRRLPCPRPSADPRNGDGTHS